MSREVAMRSPVLRQQPLLMENNSTKSSGGGGGSGASAFSSPKEKRRIAEMAGGTAAECAAICCCCPCSVMNLLILAVYKVPAGLCRKAWNNRKRQRLIKKRKKNGLLLHHRPGGGVASASASGTGDLEAEMKRVKGHDQDLDGETEAVDLEKEMWERFFGGGFWRSPSQRETSSS